ncbi:MAG: phenylalanine--tRNA ligase subunit beta [Acidimicrobiales bacterium]
MRAPLSWIRDFTPVDAPAREVASALSSLGLVVEATEEVEAPWPGIVVARVLATRAHPAADRIQLVDVDPGDGEAVQVCCGAFNLKAGDLVPLATVGAVMPSGAEIGRRKMRGEWSNGMLCSAPELGIGPEGPTPAIFIFPPGSASPGQAAAEAIGLSADVVFDLEISPNRSDCFSVAGVARDLAAAMGLPFSVPEPPRVVSAAVEGATVAVSPEAADLCPRFTGTVLEGVGNATVPALVGRRLALAGMRPISPVVDVSNYVMLELGQPNHPYDIGRLGGRGLVVRRAAPGERVVTLDGSARRLTPDDLVIADSEGAPVGIAGIMGAASAEIAGSTTTVLLEVANFLPGAVSATGKRLGLLSEARTRFERGVDVELPERAVDRFAQLLGPQVRRGQTTDIRNRMPENRVVRLRAARVNLVLGTSLAPEQCAGLIAPLGFEARAGAEGEYRVTVPTWRPDCTREVDLVEEVARLYGYDNIARAMPPRPMAVTRLNAYQRRRRRARQVLAGVGADEAWTSTFVSAADLGRAGLQAAEALEVENPLDRAQDRLRTSLLPGLLRAARSNVERQAGAVSLFEIGSVFRRPRPGDSPLIEDVAEAEQLGLVAVGPRVDASYAVRVWEVLADGLRLEAQALQPLPPPPTSGTASGESVQGGPSLSALAALHPGRRAAVMVEGERVGLVGELAPEVAARHGLSGRVAVMVLDLSPLLGGRERGRAARAVSRYPATDLDMAFDVAEEVPAGRLAETVLEAAGELAEAVALFDVWRGPPLGEGRRSLGFRARLRAPDRTLTDAEVADVRVQVAAAALARHGAVLRTA